jgi:hypothetical protein
MTKNQLIAEMAHIPGHAEIQVLIDSAVIRMDNGDLQPMRIAPENALPVTRIEWLGRTAILIGEFEE